jgi:TusA-related sulfurtransferase
MLKLTGIVKRMEESKIDLMGKICPYPVVNIIREVDKMRSGETRIFVVDDPLCIKSVPDELEEYDNFKVTILKIEKGWEIKIMRS